MTSYQSLIFFLLIVSGECYLIESVNFSRQSDQVNSFSISELDDESESTFMLNDNYPVFFKCSFELYNQTFEIVFRRTNLRQPDNIQRSLFFYYESDHVHVNGTSKYQAHGILFKRPNQTQTATRSFDIVATLLELEDSVLVSLLDIRLVTDLNATNKYRAFKSLPTLTADDKEKYKRVVTEPMNVKKLNLFVEACVHVEYSVFRRVQAFFGNENADFVRIYLASYFASKVSGVNKIFQSFEHPRFKIDVVLSDLVIHESFDATNNIQLNASSARDLFARATPFKRDYLPREIKVDQSDLVFYIHANQFAEATLGLAYLRDVCQPGLLTSLILNVKNEPLELVMAHELAHSKYSQFCFYFPIWIHRGDQSKDPHLNPIMMFGRNLNQTIRKIQTKFRIRTEQY